MQRSATPAAASRRRTCSAGAAPVSRLRRSASGRVASVLQEVLDRAVQVHGALGVTDDPPLAFWYRHERAARIYDGPDEVHRAVVARRVLRGFGVEIE